MAAIGFQHLALGIALAVTSAGCSSWRPPVVVKVARTINNAETISNALLDTIYDVSSPEKASQTILKSLRESGS